MKRCCTAVIALWLMGGGCYGGLSSPSEDHGDGIDESDDEADVDLPPSEHPELLPAGVRRLTHEEYRASIRAVFGFDLPSDMLLPPDALQDGFSRNHAQRVDPVLAKQLDGNAKWVAEQVVAQIQNFAPCSSGADESACAREFIETYGARAYRRPLDDEEVDGLAGLYAAGREDGRHADGIALVVRALVQAAGFLYVTEIGEDADPGEDLVQLSAYEIAAAISYLAIAEPPDAALLEAADDGDLDDPSVRVEHFDRLLTRDGSSQRALVRILREWLGIATIAAIAKDSTVYPQFASLRDAMDRESLDFIAAVLASEGTVAELLSADWTMAEGSLAQAYGASGSQRVSLASTSRRGILNQGAFLSVFAHASESAPILRGVAVLHRLLCYEVQSPTTLNIMVVPPVPDPNKTTRERFQIHSADPACASCHRSIDNVGFTFEGFDGMGMARVNGMENNQRVDTSTSMAIGVDVDGEFADSAALAQALSASEDVRTCFARHLFRAAATRSDDEAKDAEEAFVAAWSANDDAASGHIIETLRTYVASEDFRLRRGR